MYAYCNTLCDDNGNVVSTHESHWKACEAMLAIGKTAERPHTQINLDAFCAQLTAEYTTLFASDADYAFAASNNTPAALARKMTLGLDNGQATKDGKGIVRTCKHFDIPHTYKAIRAFLKAQ